MKDSNRHQADHVAVKLRCVGAGFNQAHMGATIHEILNQNNDMLAKLEHRRWVAERLLAGWRLCESIDKKDSERKLHPHMVPWDRLKAETQQFDVDAIENIPELIEQRGWNHYWSKIFGNGEDGKGKGV